MFVGSSVPITGVVVGTSFCRTTLGAGADTGTEGMMGFLMVSISSMAVFDDDDDEPITGVMSFLKPSVALGSFIADVAIDEV